MVAWVRFLSYCNRELTKFGMKNFLILRALSLKVYKPV